MDVLEDEDQRPRARERLHDLPDRPEGLLPATGLAEGAGRSEDALDDQVGVGLTAEGAA